MKFDKIIGNKDKYAKEISITEDALTAVFLELSMTYGNKTQGSKMGGDIVVHQLVYTQPHIADLRGLEVEDEEERLAPLVKDGSLSEIEKDKKIAELEKSLGKHILYTAATNGKHFFWYPRFINKLSRTGLRLVINHEAWHALYMHPSRRGTRIPYLWNIAVDFKVNFTLMDDLRLRGFHDFAGVFKKELGDYASLQEYASFLKDPFHPPAKLAHWNPIHSLKSQLDPSYQRPNKEIKGLFFAEPNLSEDFKHPENIYDYLINQIPKCKDCKRQPAYDLPEEYRALKKEVRKLHEAQK